MQKLYRVHSEKIFGLLNECFYGISLVKIFDIMFQKEIYPLGIFIYEK